MAIAMNAALVVMQMEWCVWWTWTVGIRILARSTIGQVVGVFLHLVICGWSVEEVNVMVKKYIVIWVIFFTTYFFFSNLLHWSLNELEINSCWISNNSDSYGFLVRKLPRLWSSSITKFIQLCMHLSLKTTILEQCLSIGKWPQFESLVVWYFFIDKLQGSAPETSYLLERK